MTKHMQCLPNNTFKAFWSKELRKGQRKQIYGGWNMWSNIAVVCEKRKLKIT